MAYDTKLADRIRDYLEKQTKQNITEKAMFGGLAFLVDDKMCVNVSGENLMCRFDPGLQKDVANKTGFQPMIMKGKELAGYCYIHPIGFTSEKDFQYWINLCLDFNEKAKSSKKNNK
jgi:TfoX/Sxy family transcriptional regulator of competence genes